MPLVGLFLFAVLTYASIRFNRQARVGSHKYFYWSSIRLDTRPLDPHFLNVLCGANQPDCPPWEPEFIWVEPGLLARICITSSFPAFLIGLFITHRLGRLGVSEFATFMTSMPPLIFAWYYLVSWTIARFVGWRLKRR